MQGRTEFIEKYFETVRDLRARGFAVAALDWRGQGLSERALADPCKGHVEKFSEYDLDLETFMQEIVLPDCPPPIFAIGHSMGATMLIRAAHAGRRWFDRVVLSAPMIGLPKLRGIGAARMTTRLLRLAMLGASYVPGGEATIVGTQPFLGNLVTSDPVRYARNAAVLEQEPALGLGAPTVAWADAAFRVMAELQGAGLCGQNPPADADRGGRQRRDRLHAGDRGFRAFTARRLASHRPRRAPRIADGAGPHARTVLGGIRCLRSRHAAVRLISGTCVAPLRRHPGIGAQAFPAQTTLNWRKIPKDNELNPAEVTRLRAPDPDCSEACRSGHGAMSNPIRTATSNLHRNMKDTADTIGTFLVDAFHLLALFVIGATTVWSAVTAFIAMVAQGRASLGDILLLFVYLEIGAMVGIYFRTTRLPVRYSSILQ